MPPDTAGKDARRYKIGGNATVCSRTREPAAIPFEH
jgi:hypothetical protein